MSTGCETASSARVTTIPLRTREAIEQEIQRRVEATLRSGFVERLLLEAANEAHCRT